MFTACKVLLWSPVCNKVPMAGVKKKEEIRTTMTSQGLLFSGSHTNWKLEGKKSTGIKRRYFWGGEISVSVPLQGQVTPVPLTQHQDADIGFKEHQRGAEKHQFIHHFCCLYSDRCQTWDNFLFFGNVTSEMYENIFPLRSTLRL